ncbi:hypothetical protein L484_001920 [Morus notabilis]|uniref:Uncharacterized protein n=1 Tax=Morus notabilis TaxID=981085 RepID=W9R6V1_9ROSA|nr:hypothetical protein L484_001920 [Morus notabilis]
MAASSSSASSDSYDSSSSSSYRRHRRHRRSRRDKDKDRDRDRDGDSLKVRQRSSRSHTKRRRRRHHHSSDSSDSSSDSDYSSPSVEYVQRPLAIPKQEAFGVGTDPVLLIVNHLVPTVHYEVVIFIPLPWNLKRHVREDRVIVHPLEELNLQM